MGYSLRRLLMEMEPGGTRALEAIDELSFLAAFAFAVVRASIDPREALAAYLFSWLENQALAALKAIPLGQTEGQKLLRDIARDIPGIIERAAAMTDDELANFAPGLALAASRHETQYSRIFRS
jgi:urease accessory protein